MRAKDRAAIYNKKQWRDVRGLAFIRDEMLCVHCKHKGLMVTAECVHHVKYLEHRIDLAYDLDNLESLCNKCHMLVHAND